jgi:SAM-dependent methyltransferase
VWRADYPNNATWFEDHYYAAPRQIVDFFGGDGVSLEGKMIADIGTGDGIMALGLFDLAKPEQLVGYDVEEVDTDELVRIAREHGIDALPEGLRFDLSSPDRVPAATGAFDFVLSWSVFEHAADPLALAKEMRRLLAPGGVVMIQLYPFYYSEHGDHGWTRPSFEHLSTGRDGTDLPLNRITLDRLHKTLWTARLRTAKVELICSSFHVPPDLAQHPLTDLAIGGVKLTAVPF